MVSQILQAVDQLKESPYHVGAWKILHEKFKDDQFSTLSYESVPQHVHHIWDIIHPIMDLLNTHGFNNSAVGEDFLNRPVAEVVGETTLQEMQAALSRAVFEAQLLHCFGDDDVKTTDQLIEDLAAVYALTDETLSPWLAVLEKKGLLETVSEPHVGWRKPIAFNLSGLEKEETSSFDLRQLEQREKDQQSETAPQDMSIIRGLTEVYENLLAQADIFTYAQLAACTLESLRVIITDPSVTDQLLVDRIADATLLSENEDGEDLLKKKYLSSMYGGVTAYHQTNNLALFTGFEQEIGAVDAVELVEGIRQRIIAADLLDEQRVALEELLENRLSELKQNLYDTCITQINALTDPDGADEIRALWLNLDEEQQTVLEELLRNRISTLVVDQLIEEMKRIATPQNYQDSEVLELYTRHQRDERILPTDTTRLVQAYAVLVSILSSLNIYKRMQKSDIEEQYRLLRMNEVNGTFDVESVVELEKAFYQAVYVLYVAEISNCGTENRQQLIDEINGSERIYESDKQSLIDLFPSEEPEVLLEENDTGPQVDPRYVPHLRRLKLTELSYKPFALPEERLQYSKQSATADVMTLQLLTQEILGTNGHNGRVIKLAGIYGAVVKEPAPKIQFMRKTPPEKTESGYVGEFTVVLLNESVLPIQIVYNTGKVYTVSGRSKKTYTEMPLELSDYIYLDKEVSHTSGDGTDVTSETPLPASPLVVIDTPTARLNAELFQHAGLYNQIATKMGFDRDPQKKRVIGYLETFFHHEQLLQDFEAAYRNAYASYLQSAPKQPIALDKVIAVCTLLFGREYVGIYTSDFYSLIEGKLKNHCIEADKLFDEKDSDEGMAAKAKGAVKRQVTFDPAQKKVQIALGPDLQDYFDIQTDKLTGDSYTVSDTVALSSDVVTKNRVRVTNPPGLKYGYDYTVVHEDDPTQFGIEILDYTKVTFPLDLEFLVEGDATYTSAEYGDITGKRSYTCFCTIEAAGLSDTAYEDRRNRTMTSQSLESLYEKKKTTMIDSYLTKRGLPRSDHSYRYMLAVLFDPTEHIATPDPLRVVCNDYLVHQKKQVKDEAGMDAVYTLLVDDPEKLWSVDSTYTLVDAYLTDTYLTHRLRPDRSTNSTDPELCGYNTLYGVDPYTSREYTVSTDEDAPVSGGRGMRLLKRFFGSKKTQKKYYNETIKFGGANSALGDGSVDEGERHSNNYLYGIPYETTGKKVSTRAGDEYTILVQIPTNSGGQPFSVTNNFDIQLTITSTATPPLEDDLLLETGASFNGTCYQVRERISHHPNLLERPELRNQVLCIFEHQVVTHLEATIGLLVGQLTLPGHTIDLPVRVRSNKDGLIVEYAPNGDTKGPWKVYERNGVPYTQQKICTQGQESVNTFLAIVRDIVDESQYDNKVRLLYGEPQDKLPTNSEVFQYDPQTIEAAYPLQELYNLGVLNGMDKHTGIAIEKVFPLPNGSSITLGIANVDEDDTIDSDGLQIYYQTSSGHQVAFGCIEDLLRDPIMIDKFSLFVQFNDYFMQEFAVHFNALKENQGLAVVDQYTGMMLGVKQVNGKLVYGIVSNPPSSLGDPRNHELPVNSTFESDTSLQAKHMLLSHPELFQLIWVKMFEHGEPSPAYLKAAEARRVKAEKEAAAKAEQAQKEQDEGVAKFAGIIKSLTGK